MCLRPPRHNHVLCPWLLDGNSNMYCYLLGPAGNVVALCITTRFVGASLPFGPRLLFVIYDLRVIVRSLAFALSCIYMVNECCSA